MQHKTSVQSGQTWQTFLDKMIGKLKKELESLKEESGQTSVEVILLIGSILVITIIAGTYVFSISSNVNSQFNQTMSKARIFLLNNI